MDCEKGHSTVIRVEMRDENSNLIYSGSSGSDNIFEDILNDVLEMNCPVCNLLDSPFEDG